MKRFLRFAAVAAVFAVMVTVLSACNKEDTGGKPTVYPYATGDAFVTNLVGSKKMLKCSVSFEVTDKKFADAVADTQASVRNAVIKVLVQLTESEVLENVDLSAIEQRLTEAANTTLDTEVFYSAIITEFTAN